MFVVDPFWWPGVLKNLRRHHQVENGHWDRHGIGRGSMIYIGILLGFAFVCQSA